jgi:spermidine synthase
VTVHATTAVLATFLAGLAWGGWALGRAADRSAAPLRLFGLLEIGVGLTAALGVGLLGLLEPVHVWAANRFQADGPSLVAARMLLAAVVALPPTFLMGGTLPTLTRAVVAGMERMGRDFSLLYALNTAGAVAGTLAAGFWLIGAIGRGATLALAVALNLAVGAAAITLSRRAAPGPSEEPAPSLSTGAPVGAGLLVALALSGVSSMGLEVLWTRVLMLSVGTTTYAFATMLAAFLTGIALGGFLVRSVVDRLARPRLAFGWVQLAIAAAVLGTLPLLGSGLTQRWLHGLGDQPARLALTRFGVSFLIMLPATTLIGTTLPIAARIRATERRALGGRLGQVYGANTAGNIAGAALASFALLPALGLQRGIAVLAALHLAIAAWSFLPARATARRLVLRGLPAALALAAALALTLRWQPAPFASWDEQPDDALLFYREGVAATVKVLERRSGLPMRLMTVDGITIGQSFGGVDAKQQALAHFPFLLAPDRPPRRILTIGLGTGIVAGEMLRHPGVESLTCIEISPEVIEGARRFERWNHEVLDDARARIVAEDGVNFLRRTGGTYDAIVSDAKSRTTHAANATFLSEDYYRLCAEHLAPGGVMLQWVPLEVSPSELRIILATFRGVFPEIRVWLSPPQSALLVGSHEPPLLDALHVERELAAPWTDRLRAYGWRDAQGFLALLAADTRSLAAALPAGTPWNTLDRPVLEFYSPRDYAVPPARHWSDNLEFLSSARISGVPAVANADPAELGAAFGAAADLVTATANLVRPRPRAVAESVELIRAALPVARRLLPLRHVAIRALERALVADPRNAPAHDALADLFEAEGLAAEAAAHREEVRRLRPD